MTVKQFFKSTAFKSLAVLIVIVLVAGALLAIFNDLLYVSDEERLARSLAKIYGTEVTAEEIELSEEERTYNNGTVDAVYYVHDDGNYLFQTTGKGGYSNGTVTLWTIITCTGSREENDLVLTGIEKVVYDSNSGQTLMGNFGESFYALFANQDELVAGGKDFTANENMTGDLNNIVAGASMTSTAICNAVNTALACFRTVFIGGEA